MAAIFQVRRGDSSNTSSLVNGELYLNNAENAFQVGTNSNPIKLLSLNTASFGDIILTGSAYISGNVVLGGTITIGDSTSDNVVVNADLSSSIIPNNDNAFDLGSSSKRYKEIYGTDIYGAIKATNGVVSGSSQITYASISSIPVGIVSGSSQVTPLLPTGTVSGSSQVVSILSSINTYTGSNDTTNTAQSARLTTLESVTGSYETKGRSIVSGSSQITPLLPTGTVSGSTQVTPLLPTGVVSGSAQVTPLLPTGTVSGSTQITNLGYATTGSNLFIGNQSINGNLYLTGSLIPSGNFVYDLGSATNGFGDVYLSSSTVYMNNNPIFGTTDVVPVFVGDYLQGGIVYYVDTVNGFSYIVNKDDIGQVDSSNFTRVGSANSNVLGGGITNTNAITASTGGQQNPAKLCSDFSGSGYTDWYLPSTRELALIASNTNLMAASLAGVRYVRYWTSTVDSRNALKTYFAGDANSDDQHYTGYGIGNDMMYSVPDGNASVGYVKAVRRTNITEIIRTLSFPNFNFSGSLNVAGTIDGIAIGAFVTQSNERIINLESSSANLNIVSSSLNTFTSSASGRLNNIEAATSSYETKGRGIVSGSSQLSGTTITNLTITNLTTVNETASVIFSSGSNRFGDFGDDVHDFTGSVKISGSQTIIGSSTATSFNGTINATNGVVSGSSQVTPLLPTGIVSGSTQITYASISSIPSGIVSGSTQVITLLPTGVVSSSAQTIVNLPTGTVSGSSQITTFGFVSSSVTASSLVTASVNVNILTFTKGNGSTFDLTIAASGSAPAGTISGSAQIIENLPTGVVSGSSQVITSNAITLGTHTTGNYVATIAGTANQITVAGSGLETAAVTLSTPQDIHTSANIQFNSIGLGTAASGVAGEVRATGDITAFYSSDIRLKENIFPIRNALQKVNEISGNTYDWKEGFEEIHSHKGNDVGVIAQEIEEILPQIVTNRDNGYKAVQYEKIIPLLIEAIKELSAKIKDLENK